MFLCIDTTYRIIVEGHGLMLIGTMSVNQNFHTIAYAIVSKEDEVAHTWVLATLKKGVESLVNKRIIRGDKSI